jgi:hypothetical protein
MSTPALLDALMKSQAYGTVVLANRASVDQGA